MKIYAITVQPTSPFGTPLKGDTLFGHFCWQAAEDGGLLQGGLDHWISRYHESPFAVFSSAWPVLQHGAETFFAVARPPLGTKGKEMADRRQRILHHKADKKRTWLLLDSTLHIDLTESSLKTDEELFELFLDGQPRESARALRLLGKNQRKLYMPVTRAHNSINRLTMTTGGGMFTPYSHENIQYLPGLSLIIFVAVKQEALGAEQLRSAFKRIGSWGFGRDASSGLGRFTVQDVQEIPWPGAGESHTGCYTLGPCVPQKKTFARTLATPFTRFGRHGAALAASGNPFKKPVVMADEGAVLYPVDRVVFTSPYIGTAIGGVSAVDKRTVVQGYTLYLPC